MWRSKALQRDLTTSQHRQEPGVAPLREQRQTVRKQSVPDYALPPVRGEGGSAATVVVRWSVASNALKGTEEAKPLDRKCQGSGCLSAMNGSTGEETEGRGSRPDVSLKRLSIDSTRRARPPRQRTGHLGNRIPASSPLNVSTNNYVSCQTHANKKGDAKTRKTNS